MSARLLLLCPGQGDQHEQMFGLARSTPAGAALLAQLGMDGIDSDSLYANRSAQPMIVAAALAMWAALRDFLPAPALVAGYSIGELSAYGVSGALSAPQAVALSRLRAQLMDDCAGSAPHQAMLAISGMTVAQLAPLLAQHGYHLSITTGDDSCIVGGAGQHAPALLEQAVTAAGGRCKRLPVAVASHTPCMGAAVAPFAAALEQAEFTAMAAPVLAGIDASLVHGRPQAIATLSRQLADTIRWDACMDACAEAGITLALELGPGSALSRMLRARHPQISCRSVDEFRSIEGIRHWVERQTA